MHICCKPTACKTPATKIEVWTGPKKYVTSCFLGCSLPCRPQCHFMNANPCGRPPFVKQGLINVSIYALNVSYPTLSGAILSLFSVTSPTILWRSAAALRLQQYSGEERWEWTLLITKRYQRSPKKPICHWLKETATGFGHLEVRLGQLSSENAAVNKMNGELLDVAQNTHLT